MNMALILHDLFNEETCKLIQKFKLVIKCNSQFLEIPMFTDRGVEREGSEVQAGKRAGDINSPGPDRKQTKTLNPQTGNKRDYSLSL